MNDPLIRQSLHRDILQRYHADPHTLVVDELGLNHGESRADIAVINGLLVGYEIKSNEDSLNRLEEQVKAYNAIFDKITIVIGTRHLKNIHNRIPSWWGIISAVNTSENTAKFNLVRKCNKNTNICPVSIARLLWRDEVLELLKQRKFTTSDLRKPRAFLYEILAETVSI